MPSCTMNPVPMLLLLCYAQCDRKSCAQIILASRLNILLLPRSFQALCNLLFLSGKSDLLFNIFAYGLSYFAGLPSNARARRGEARRGSAACSHDGCRTDAATLYDASAAADGS